MANKTLFQSLATKLFPANATNAAGGAAYAMSAKHALAQYACTGCMNQTFYAAAEQQLATVVELCRQLQPEFIAETAVYARQRGFMKDLPALLAVILSVRSPGLLAEVWDRVIDDAKMLRNFVQIVRSGVAGRNSLGTMPKRLIEQWLDARTDEQVFRASVGNDPSLADIIRLVHPRPKTASRSALYGHLLGKKVNFADLCVLVCQYENFKQSVSRELPDVPFQMLTALELTPKHWKEIAAKGSWQMTRMNLNTFARHGVFEDKALVKTIADRLRDPELIGKAKVFPYQLMVAYAQCDAEVPREVREALRDAMEVAIRNVPSIDGKVYVCPDISGSMQSPVTGHRKGSTSAVTCLQVAALVAAAVLRKNPSARALPFSDDVVHAKLNPAAGVLANAAKLAKLPSGGTNCSAPLRWLNDTGATGDLVIFVSDNESWIDSTRPSWLSGGARSGPTETLKQWTAFKRRNPRARLVCIDVQPNCTTQAPDGGDVLNVGGFGDSVFDLVHEFAAGTMDAGGRHWIDVIERVRL